MNKDTGAVPALEEVADRLAIADVLYSHSRGLDRLDADLLKSCYWPDAEVDYGAYKGSAHEFAEFVVVALKAQYTLTRHCLSNSLPSLNQDIAVVESYVDAAHLLPDSDESMAFAGRYLDRLEKRGKVWKLQHRQVVMDWYGPQPALKESDNPALSELSRGAHLPEDPLQQLLSKLN
jgi:hypothetical protein